jgi:hypothetical protein
LKLHINREKKTPRIHETVLVDTQYKCVSLFYHPSRVILILLGPWLVQGTVKS